MDPRLQAALLQDPAVQDAVRKAGQDALSDPMVQQTIIDTIRDKFPEYAAYSGRMVAEWAQDPEVQRQACHYAGVAMMYAGQVGGQIGEQLVGLIEQGPSGLRLLAFGGGVCCVVLAGRTILNPASLAFGPIMYILSVYLAAFSLTTMLFEAEQAWISKIPSLDVYQNLVLEKAKFLSEAYGRGLIYGFQGTLWLSLYGSVTSPLELGLGLFFIFLAVLHVLMSFGVMPQQVARKMREGHAAAAGLAARNGYMQLPTNPPPLATADALAPMQPRLFQEEAAVTPNKNAGGISPYPAAGLLSPQAAGGVPSPAAGLLSSQAAAEKLTATPDKGFQGAHSGREPWTSPVPGQSAPNSMRTLQDTYPTYKEEVLPSPAGQVLAPKSNMKKSCCAVM